MSEVQPRVSLWQEGDIKVLRVEIQEVVDYDVADALGEALIEAAGNGPPLKIVVDMGGITFLSSVGYTPFIQLRAHVRKLKGQLILANMTEMIREVFDATRLLINPSSPKSLFNYCQTVDDAIAELA